MRGICILPASVILALVTAAFDPALAAPPVDRSAIAETIKAQVRDIVTGINTRVPRVYKGG